MGTVLLFAGLWFAWHVFGLIIWPLRSCSLCKGASVHRGWPRTAFRPCLKCKGSGTQPRMEVRILRRIRTKRQL
jgi:hypothetical protein